MSKKGIGVVWLRAGEELMGLSKKMVPKGPRLSEEALERLRARAEEVRRRSQSGLPF